MGPGKADLGLVRLVRVIVGARHWVSKRNMVQSVDSSGFSALPQPIFSF